MKPPKTPGQQKKSAQITTSSKPKSVKTSTQGIKNSTSKPRAKSAIDDKLLVKRSLPKRKSVKTTPGPEKSLPADPVAKPKPKQTKAKAKKILDSAEIALIPGGKDTKNKRSKTAKKAVARATDSRESLPAPTLAVPSEVAQKPQKIQPPKIPDLLFQGELGPDEIPELPRLRTEDAPNLSRPLTPEFERVIPKMLVVPRSPNSLFVHCDLSPSLMERARTASVDRSLVLKLIRDRLHPRTVSQTNLVPGEHNICLNAPSAGTDYKVELGFVSILEPGVWHLIVSSDWVTTPALPQRELVSEDSRFGDVLYLVKSSVEKNIPIVEVIQHLHVIGQLSREEISQIASAPWPEPQAKALKQLDQTAHVWSRPTSASGIRPFLLNAPSLDHQLAPSRPTSYRPRPTSNAAESQGASPSSDDFWLNVNVELVVYGATQTDARLRVGGKEVKLAKDGTFRLRYGLPDGAYNLTIEGASASDAHRKDVHLHVARATAHSDGVGQAPVDPTLSTPQ